MYWICLPYSPETLNIYGTPDTAELPTITRDDSICLPVGHISLDKQDWPEVEGMEPELGLTSPDGSVLTITTLFVRTKYSESRLKRNRRQRPARHAENKSV